MVAERLAGLKNGQRADRQGGSKEPATLSRKQAAETMGVSLASVKRAREVRQSDPDLAEKVVTGDMTLTKATRELKKRQ
jgi:hypothetical protein